MNRSNSLSIFFLVSGILMIGNAMITTLTSKEHALANIVWFLGLAICLILASIAVSLLRIANKYCDKQDKEDEDKKKNLGNR